MIGRYRDDSEKNYQSRCKVGQWELPLVEVVLMMFAFDEHMKPVFIY
ncbi:MAG: hypothetical protein Q8L79_14945 [Methylobacter sp.]|nr:hypothetical protein [Methylobacter sp.]MDP1666406.1 hypothetical protein [Methylobacter sp.]MDP1970729.1 hypothetical protein [Methylobacter sp.]